jgi:molybdate transport system substrate-binding protein
MPFKPVLASIAFLFSLLSSAVSTADTLTVAVASNFAGALHQLAQRFEEKSGHKLRISSASTGKIYSQIKNGAPFDVFMSADEVHVDRLVKEGQADARDAAIYALGKLVFISNLAPAGKCQDVLSDARLKYLAIANPSTAPYGAAARQVMEHLSVWEKLQPRLVLGENIAQTLQFVESTSANAGFVAKSMLIGEHVVKRACDWQVPDTFYTPIKQKMALLNRSRGNPAALSFWRFMHSAEAAAVIRDNGYDVPALSKRNPRS